MSDYNGKRSRHFSGSFQPTAPPSKEKKRCLLVEGNSKVLRNARIITLRRERISGASATKLEWYLDVKNKLSFAVANHSILGTIILRC